MDFCACGQEARIIEDRMENGQVSRFCGTCGKAPRPRSLPALDVEVPRSQESVELDIRLTALYPRPSLYGMYGYTDV